MRDKLHTMILSTYPLPRRWPRLKRHLKDPEVLRVLECSMRAIRPEYDVQYHIPREVGWTVDIRWPRSRIGWRAYQCFGYCHAIAPVMLTLLQHAEPRKKWVIVAGEDHSIVMSSNGEVLDINAADIEDPLACAKSILLKQGVRCTLYDSADKHFEDVLACGQFLSPYAIRSQLDDPPWSGKRG